MPQCLAVRSKEVVNVILGNGVLIPIVTSNTKDMGRYKSSITFVNLSVDLNNGPADQIVTDGRNVEPTPAIEMRKD